MASAMRNAATGLLKAENQLVATEEQIEHFGKFTFC